MNRWEKFGLVACISGSAMAIEIGLGQGGSALTAGGAYVVGSLLFIFSGGNDEE